MMEAGVLIDKQGNPLYWHLPNDRSGGALPDSRDLWSVIWENKDNISGFAHSHPGFGKTGPSFTDITTFMAVEKGLGKRLDWWITSGNSMILLRWIGPKDEEYKIIDVPDASWTEKLREHSNY